MHEFQYLFDEGKDNKEILKVLNESKGYIKRELAKK